LVRLGALWSAWNVFGQSGFALVSLDALWSTWMHFG
jgi:hypothetical protein